MTEAWPKHWQGQTNLTCGTDGPALTLVSTPSQPCGIHEQNFRTIVTRWETIWPEFRRVITDLMASYRQEPPDWSAIQAVYLELSDEPIAEDAEWSVGVVFSAHDTLWSLPYRGFTACPERAQAVW